MENDIEQARASDIQMATNIVENLDILISTEQNSSESRRSECCIYRVPQPLRKVNWEVYAPQLISIGPLHRNNEKLQATLKPKNYKKLTERNGMDREKRRDIVISIKNQEERLRYCYSDKFKKIKSNDFVEMILLDAVFIIEFFLESNDDTGPKHFKPRMTYDIREDLMLLENQLPLSIIDKIYDQPGCKESTAIPRRYSPDLVKLKYSAIMLHKAGVRFQVTRDECLVNIKFEKGVLKIPHLKVDHNFERLVRNIMAMEECLYEGEAYICSYIKFMDHLIDSAGDVGLLVENGIILHWLGDDAAVSNMINNLCKNISDNDTCFGDISKELNAHYDNNWNHRKAPLKLVYFPDIWTGTGTVAAAILLILTLIQTIKAFL